MTPRSESRFRGTVLCLGIAALLFACERKSDKDPSAGESGRETRAASIGAAAQGASGAKPGTMDGFYVNRDYLEGLRKNLTIFGTSFPVRSLYLQIHGDSVELDFNNHEGLMADLKPLEDSNLVKHPVREDLPPAVALGQVKDSLFMAWETGSSAPSWFVKMDGGVRTIYDLYHSLLLNGTYLCRDPRLCRDSVVIRGDTVHGLMGPSLQMRLAIDWLDNLPQMDYLTLARADSSFQVAYRAHRDGLELFEIVLPKECESFRDQECPLADAKRGKRILALERIR
jgi:hypothetical protein